MSAMSDYLEAALYNHVLRGISYPSPPAVYVGLHLESPEEDESGDELFGGGYIRQLVTFGPPTAGEGSGTNDMMITFPEAESTWGMLTHFSIWDAQTNGNMLMLTPLDVPKSIGIGDVFKFKPGQIAAVFR